MTGWKTGCNWSRPVFFQFFNFLTNLATGNRKNSEFVQLQLVVRSFAVGFSSILVFVCGRWVVDCRWWGSFAWSGCWSQVVGFVCACWFVIHGHGGDVLCAGWSSLARLDGMMGVLTMNDSMNNNNERRHHHHLSFGCHIALGNMAPATIPILLILLWCGAGYACCGCGCGRLMWVAAIVDGNGEMRVVVMRQWVGIVKDGGGSGWRRK